MTRRALTAPLSLQMYSQYPLRTHLANRNCWHRVRQHAIDEPPSINVDRQEHTRIGATCAHGADQRSGLKYFFFAGAEFSRGHAEGNTQLFKGLDLQHARQKSDHTVVRGKAEA